MLFKKRYIKLIRSKTISLVCGPTLVLHHLDGFSDGRPETETKKVTDPVNFPNSTGLGSFLSES
jgi:hypothetical protein